jgi:hypothetical protein
MAKRMSNKDRIARVAAEKKAGAAEKATKKKVAKKKVVKKKTTRRKAASKRAVRMRRVYIVCDHAGNPVKIYAFNQEDVATKEAARLTTSKGKQHWVSTGREPMDEEV